MNEGDYAAAFIRPEHRDTVIRDTKADALARLSGINHGLALAWVKAIDTKAAGK